MPANEYTYIAPHGAGWLKASRSVLGGGLWFKTTGTGVILGEEEITDLINFLQGIKRKEDQ
jgi:hypothetical protein